MGVAREPRQDGKQLRIGMVVPPLDWERRPGMVLAVEGLARGLCERGHEVVLFTVDDPVCHRLGSCQVGIASRQLYEALDSAAELGDCDIVHDHSLAGLFLRNLHYRVPVISTCHRPFTDDPVPSYRSHPDPHVPLVAVSQDQGYRAPSSVTVANAIHSGIDLAQYRFRRRSDDYVVTLAPIRPDGGILTAIEIALRTRHRLLIGSYPTDPVEHTYFERYVEPVLGGDIEYRGYLSRTERIELLGGAKALLHPVSYAEPFATPVVEAMACGTPVIASRHGSAKEIIDERLTGFALDTKRQMIAALQHVGVISRSRCREHVRRYFSSGETAYQYENFYYETLVDRAAVRIGSAGLASAAVDPHEDRWRSSHI